MRLKNYFTTGLGQVVILLGIFACFNTDVKSQDITVYQFRQVPQDKAAEFERRETTYWSKVAKKAEDNGKMEFWALFEKVGGDDLQNSPNYLFINTFKNIDQNMGDVFNAKPLFPGIPIEKMETNSISKTTAEYFFRNDGWEQKEKAVPAKDFNYVVFYFHNSSNPDSFATLEKKYWAPFIKSAMDKNQTSQTAWGNAVVLTPAGNDVKFNSISFDLFPTLKDALIPRWDANVTFPGEGMSAINNIRLNRPSREVYRVVKVVSKTM
jgi:hypothetical protein